MKASSHRRVVESNIIVVDLIISRVVFLDRIQSQEEIVNLIEEVFADKKRISLEEFQRINEEVTSEMFLSVSIHYPNSITVDPHIVVILPPLQ